MEPIMMNNLVTFYLFTMLCNIVMLFFCNKIYFEKKKKRLPESAIGVCYLIVVWV